MAFLSDEAARRIEAALADKAVDSATFTRWVRELLEDRRARTAVMQRISRRAHFMRMRFAQAARYLDGLLNDLERAASEPWPRQLPCPICGAPLDQARSEYRPDDPRHHVAVHHHADGTVCEAR